MICGVLLGRLLSKYGFVKTITQSIFPIVLILLFLMGVSIGTNETIISNLNTLGVEALIITGGALIGTLTGAALLWRFVYNRKEVRQ